MIDIRKVIPFKQSGNVCLLASYYFILEYYGIRYDEPVRSVDVFFKEYEEYMTTTNEVDLSYDGILEWMNSWNGDNNSNRADRYISIVQGVQNQFTRRPQFGNLHLHAFEWQSVLFAISHFYCQCVANDIMGYEHIRRIHNDDSFGFNRRSNFVIHQPVRVADPNEAIQIIGDHIATDDNLVAILYQTTRGGHSIVLWEQEGMRYIKDSNYHSPMSYEQYLNIANNNAFQLGQSVILEYMLIDGSCDKRIMDPQDDENLP